MTPILRPLLRGSTYAGALFSAVAALASIPLLVIALIPALLWPTTSELVQIVLVIGMLAVLVALIGIIPGVRTLLIVTARRVLAVPLPNAPRRWQSDPVRTPVWLVLQVGLGWVGMLLVTMLMAAAVALPGNWLAGTGGIALFGWSAQVDGGWVSWVLALVSLLLAVTVCVVIGVSLRALAPRLLGPSAADRLSLAAERETRLAERNRLAHELHDSIGHTLTATTIQAAVADEVMSADPTAARAALRSIEESSRAALEDLDYVLGVLRDEGDGRTAPTRTLADLPDLLDRLRHTGADVDAALPGPLDQVHGTLSRAAYRIVQEGLTNALRHGAGGPIVVRVATTPDALEIDVVNRTGARTAPAPEFPTSGHGLPGLIERVRLLHGRIDVGPDGSDRWYLAVRLPLRPTP